MTKSTASQYTDPASVPADPVEYDKWFRAQVQASLDDPRPGIPHEQVMAEMRAVIENPLIKVFHLPDEPNNDQA